ncbi:MAG: rhodanese-like domain-containing protein [Pseudohongiellaceae bacterium]
MRVRRHEYADMSTTPFVKCLRFPRLLMLWVALQFPLVAVAAPAGWSVLLEPVELAAILERNPAGVRVVHVTGDFRAGHIPGAAQAVYSQFRGPQTNPGALPDLAHLTDQVRQLGITAQTPVVIVHQGSSQSDMGAATRVYWTLKSLGVQDLAVLNGGFGAWLKQGLPVTTAAEPVAASNFEPQWLDDWRMTTNEVEALLDDASMRLIDARPPGFFEGLQASSARPGTIRGAGNLSFESWFDGNRMRSPDQVGAILASHEPPPAPVTVSFCNTGHLASINWFVMSEVLGIEHIRLYAESMTEWSQTDRPMDNEPSRLRHYWDMTTSWYNELIGS